LMTSRVHAPHAQCQVARAVAKIPISATCASRMVAPTTRDVACRRLAHWLAVAPAKHIQTGAMTVCLAANFKHTLASACLVRLRVAKHAQTISQNAIHAMRASSWTGLKARVRLARSKIAKLATWTCRSAIRVRLAFEETRYSAPAGSPRPRPCAASARACERHTPIMHRAVAGKRPIGLAVTQLPRVPTSVTLLLWKMTSVQRTTLCMAARGTKCAVASHRTRPFRQCTRTISQTATRLKLSAGTLTIHTTLTVTTVTTRMNGMIATTPLSGAGHASVQ